MVFASLFTILANMFVAPSSSQAQDSGEAEVRKTLSHFIDAFDNLEWERFRSAFSDDATVFFPREFPEGAEGRAAIEEKFKIVFEHIRAGRTSGPYMDLQPRGMKIQMAGDVAIATFYLDDRPGFVNRRTIVLRKTGRGWKIIHLHASEVRVASETLTN